MGSPMGDVSVYGNMEKVFVLLTLVFIEVLQ